MIVIIVCAALLVSSLVYTFFSIEGTEPWEEKVAIVRMVGTISPSELGQTVNPRDVKELIREAEENPSVKAIVIEIDSPGGSPVSSDEIARAIKDAEKPVVAWMGDVGASGAYWVASAADRVVAHPMSITGSIGAYSMIFTISGFMEEYGLDAEVVKSAEFKDVGSLFRNATPEEIAIFQEIVDEIHEEFVQEVAGNRGLEVEEVRKLADGKPFTGKHAKEVGLVDELGNLEDAIQLAAELGGIVGEAETVVLEMEKPFLPYLFSKVSENFGYGFGSGIAQNFGGGQNPSLSQ